MGARSSAGEPPSPDALSTRPDPQPVISVSARSSPANPSQAPVEVFLAPRVIDQAVLDHTIAELRSLIEQARQIQQSLDQASGQAALCSTQWQERLSLGARMLKAFQAQIDHVDGALAAHEPMHAQMQQAVEKFQQLQRRLDGAANRTGRHWTGKAEPSLGTRVSEPVLVEVRTLADAVRSAASRVEELLAVIDESGQAAPPLPFRANRA